ncbi:MAG: FixH family protein [bacterium]
MPSVSKKEFKLTGWHVLFVVVLFFSIITAVNAIMITYALKTFPGENQKKSYLQGLHYNQTLQAREKQSELGWRVILLDGDHLPADNTSIKVSVLDKLGQPVSGLHFTATIGRSVTDKEDRDIVFEELNSGTYITQEKDLSAGQWVLILSASNNMDQEISATATLWLN